MAVHGDRPSVLPSPSPPSGSDTAREPSPVDDRGVPTRAAVRTLSPVPRQASPHRHGGDRGAPGPRDAGTPEETGPRDAGTPEETGPRDAGTPEETGPRDAGTPEETGPPPGTEEEPSDAPQTGAPAASAATRWAPWALFALFLVLYTALALLRYARLGFQSPDVTVFEQAIRGYAHLRAPVVDIKGPGYHHLGDHFHPLVVVFAPLYRLFPGPGILLVQQSALFALSVLPVTRVAVRRFGTASGVTLGLAYGASWGLQNAVNFDFHEVCLAVPLLAFALEALLDGRPTRCALWALPLLGVKEDLGLTVAVLGGLLALRGCPRTPAGSEQGPGRVPRKAAGGVDGGAIGPDENAAGCRPGSAQRRSGVLGQPLRGARRVGAALCASGVVGFLLAVLVVVPAFNPEGRYPYMDQGGGVTVTPWGLLADLVDHQTKIWTLVLVFGVTGFLALRSPLWLATVPTILWRFHSTNPTYWGRDWHYDAVLMPIVFLALVDALGRMHGSPRTWVRAYAVRVPAVVATVAVMLVAHFPFRDFANPSTYRDRERQAAAEQALARVPDDVVVASDQALLPYIATRAKRLFLLGNTGSFRPDYLIVDTEEWTRDPGHEQDPARWSNSLYRDASYQMIFSREGYIVFRRIG